MQDYFIFHAPKETLIYQHFPENGKPVIEIPV